MGMLREILQKISSEYSISKTEPFKSHRIASYMRKEVSPLLKNFIQDSGTFDVISSPGKGNWAEVPWIAIVNPLITTTAQKGYFVVYLFAIDKKTVVLSLNQGTLSVRQEFASQTWNVLNTRAELIRYKIPEFNISFNSERINLGAKGDLSKDYEYGHVFGKEYSVEALPKDEKLILDLQKMLDLYSKSIYRDGYDSSDNNVEVNAENKLAEQRTYKMHLRMERTYNNSKLVKRKLGYRCQICTFDFEKIYGHIGYQFIESHHLKPMAELTEGKKYIFNWDDFAVLCSNCHSMVHRRNPPYTLEEMLTLIHKTNVN